MEADGVLEDMMVTSDMEEQPQKFILKDYNDHIELYRYICSGAFGFCRGMRELILPDQITEIGSYAFHDCKKLEKIVMPAGLRCLQCGMFLFCYLHDAEVILKEGLTAIESYAFSGSYLKLCIPDSVKEIAVGAFEPCGEITTLLPYDKGWFMKWPYGESVTVPASFQQGKITDVHQLEYGCFLTEVTSETDVRSYFYPSDYEDGIIIFEDMKNRKCMEEDLKRIPEAREVRNAWRRGLI